MSFMKRVLLFIFYSIHLINPSATLSLPHIKFYEDKSEKLVMGVDSVTLQLLIDL
ncbi:transmembrane protein, putative [Medicago truncatula]|uniref:Transmembrane protein, putative n=1 Tax=Medicago truncatula TaxID=3880 RepID=G7IZ99_MEDTR|nr:transmembrane protein, putative [Medicago truncatula]